ncbi:MAG: hypothetical protein M1825_005061 [Sarcosagium campestre]|nr:MAG: hypothetical protein M1825_005061 [Sarcosagium campestre]
MAKLDPESAKSAKDVLDTRARKRKRDDDDVSIAEVIEPERPKDGSESAKVSKKKRVDSKVALKDIESSKTNEESTEPKRSKTDKKRERRQKRRAKEVAKAERRAQSELQKEDAASQEGEDEEMTEAVLDIDAEIDITEKPGHSKVVKVPGHTENPSDASAAPLQNLTEQPQATPAPLQASATPSPAPESPSFDISAGHSTASSTSSIIPLPVTNSADKSAKAETAQDAGADKETAAEKADRPRKKIVDSAELRARLQVRIDALRAARKADGLDGKPARNRQELLDARRKKEEERRAHKRELRLKEKEERRLANERILAKYSPPQVGSPVHTPFEPANNFSFGRVSFADGQQMDAGLNHLIDARQPKGPRDPLGALKVAEKKKSRIQSLSEAKRREVEEMDAWLKAQKRAQGEKVKDDPSLLKKTLKRKDKAKTRSEGEWKERIDGVEKGMEARQKKREDNLQKRREGKGAGGSGKAGAKKPKKSRPGFEGSLRARVGPKRK